MKTPPLTIGLVSLYVMGNNGVRFLAATLRSAGFDVVEIYLKDFEYHHYTPPTEKEFQLLLELLDKHDVGLVGISLRAGAYLPLAKEVTQRIRERRDVPIMWGGTHVTMAPEDCFDHADFLVMGEADHSVVDIARAVASGEDVAGLAGVWLQREDRRIKNPLPPPPQLDELPLRDYTTLDRKYWVHWNRVIAGEPMLDERIYLMITSRGCLFRCGFCNVSHMRGLYKGCGAYFRYHSVEAVMEELEAAKAQFRKLRRIRFDDQLFVPDKEWIAEFARQYPKRIGLPFEILSDPRIFDDWTIETLAAIGLDKVMVGIQGVDTANARLYNRKVPDSRVVEMAESFRRHKVLGCFQIIIDDPEVTLDEKERLLELLLRLPRPYDLYIFSLCHWPGTTRTRELLTKGLIREEDVEGKTGKAFRQFLADFSWPRSAEETAFLALYELANKRVMPRRLVRRLGKSGWLRRHPWPLVGAAKALSLTKFFATGVGMVLRGEVSAAMIRRWLHVLLSPSI